MSSESKEEERVMAAAGEEESQRREKPEKEILRRRQLAEEQLHKEYTRIFNQNAENDRKRREAFVQHMKDNQPRSDAVRENGSSFSAQMGYPDPYRDPSSDLSRQKGYLYPSSIDPLMTLKNGYFESPEAKDIQGIGALEPGENNDWDQFVPMDAGRKRKGRKTRKARKSKKSKKSKKPKKSKKAKKSKNSKTAKK